jgi:ABC-type Mn2+/Zn2+ transport system ATPase subunit
MDILGTNDILHFLKSLNDGGRMAVLMISHHLEDIISAVDHLCLINQYSDTFEVGPIAEMISSDKLGSLFGRTIETHTCNGKTHVHVREN